MLLLYVLSGRYYQEQSSQITMVNDFFMAIFDFGQMNPWFRFLLFFLYLGSAFPSILAFLPQL